MHRHEQWRRSGRAVVTAKRLEPSFSGRRWWVVWMGLALGLAFATASAHAQNSGPQTTQGTGQGSGAVQGGSTPAPGTGVISPPANVDPQIRQPPKQGGATPIIPPPGTPGGNESVQPK